MSEDSLHYLPMERWEELKMAFKSDWPRNVSGVIILDTEKLIFDAGLYYGFKVYCPFGNVNNGMVAINVKNKLYEIVIQSPNDDTTILEEALKRTKLIDWYRTMQIPYAPKHIMDCVKRIIDSFNLKIARFRRTETFILDTDSKLFNVSLSSELTFKTLTNLDHLELIDSTWPHRYPGSLWFFELLIKANLGYGLFKDNQLVAWVLLKEMGALCHLYTLEKHRRKGYGEIVLKLISNTLLQSGKCVVAFCVIENVKALNLYKKLNFTSVQDVDWVEIKKK